MNIDLQHQVVCMWFVFAFSISFYISKRHGRSSYPPQTPNPTLPPTIKDYSKSNQYEYLKDFDNAYRKLPKPGRKARDPTNPQRMIIDNFLEENKNYVKGRCMEFDEFIFMERFHCKYQEMLKFEEGTATRVKKKENKFTTYGDLLLLDVYPNNTMDTIFFTEVMEHILDTKEAIQSLYRITNKCGVVFVTVPFIYMNHADPVDYFRFTPMAVNALFKREGFKAIKPAEGRGDFYTVTAAALELQGKAIPNSKSHLNKKNHRFSSGVVGLFQKPC